MAIETRFDVQTADGEVTIVAEGVLDFHNAQGFRQALLDASRSADKVVVDFRRVRYIDTAILAYLAKACNLLRERDKRLKLLLKDKTHPTRTIDLTGFMSVLDAVIDESDAE